MKSYNKLLQIAAERGIIIEERAFSHARGMVLSVDGRFFIGIHSGLSKPEKAEVLAHELGHILTGSLYDECTEQQERAKLEKNANNAARIILA